MSEEAFPGNVVTVLKKYARTITPPDDQVLTVVGRALRPVDPNFCVGIYSVDWRPDRYEIGNVGPSLAHYEYRIDLLVKHTNEEEARELHGNLAKAIRAMLYGDDALRAELGQVREESYGFRERVQKWGVRQQRFFTNDISGEFIFLAALEFYVDVESVKV